MIVIEDVTPSIWIWIDRAWIEKREMQDSSIRRRSRGGTRMVQGEVAIVESNLPKEEEKSRRKRSVGHCAIRLRNWRVTFSVRYSCANSLLIDNFSQSTFFFLFLIQIPSNEFLQFVSNNIHADNNYSHFINSPRITLLTHFRAHPKRLPLLSSFYPTFPINCRK